jgi:hypothetical protein
MVDPGAIPIKSGIAEPGQLQKKINHCLENQKGHYLRNEMLMLQFISGRFNQFLKLVYLRK